MSTSRCFIVLALCLIQALHSSEAFHKRHMTKRFNLQKNRNPNRPEPPRGTDGYVSPRNIWFDEETINGSVLEGVEFEDVTLLCNVGGVPSPSVHWLKDGKRITQQPGSCRNNDDEDDQELNGAAEDKLSIYSTSSKLFLDCLNETDQGNYTCVAQTATDRETRSVYLTVVKSEEPSVRTLKACAKKGKPARIYMKTTNVLELQGNNVRFFCRASGYPKPKITWYDGNFEVIQTGGRYTITRSGDLIIRDIDWLSDMGVFTCKASNVHGTDTSKPFLYPTARD